MTNKLGVATVGIVKAKKESLRIGFITCDTMDGDVFFHSTMCRGGDQTYDSLLQGDAVAFIPIATDKGVQAVGVTKAEP